MLAGGLWALFSRLDTGFGFWMKLLTILAMLVTALYIQIVANRASINFLEFFTIRIGFSIYAGWLIAATYIQSEYLA